MKSEKYKFLRIIILLCLMFAFTKGSAMKLPERIKELIQAIPHYNLAEENDIIHRIERDSDFCIMSENVIDTTVVSVMACYDLNREFQNFTFIVYRYGNFMNEKGIGWDFLSSGNYIYSELEGNERLLYPIFEQQKDYVESWISKIDIINNKICNTRLSFRPNYQCYMFGFRYFLLPLNSDCTQHNK